MNKKIITILVLFILIAGGTTFFFLSKEKDNAVDNEKELESNVASNKDKEEVENNIEDKEKEEVAVVNNDYEAARKEAIKGHEMSDAKMEAIAEKAFAFLLKGYTDKSFAGDADKIYNYFAPRIMFSEESMRNIIAKEFLLANIADSYIDFEYQGYARQENPTRLLVYYDITKDNAYKNSGEFIDVVGLSQIEMVLDVNGDEFKYVSLSFR